MKFPHPFLSATYIKIDAYWWGNGVGSTGEGTKMTTKISRTTAQNATVVPDNRTGAILKQVDQLAWLLDNSIHLPIVNYRIGLDALIGLIPGLGDAAGLIVSSFIVLQAIRLRAPRAILGRMVFNIVIEALIGLIPVLGDFFDATFKANVRNVRLLRLAFDQPTTSRTINQASGKGVIAAVIGTLVGLIVLIGGAGAAIFWGILSYFT